MNIIKKRALVLLTVFAVISTVFNGCKKDSPPATITYQLLTKDQIGVSGSIQFTQTSNSVTTVIVTLAGADALSHPAYILSNSAVQGGSNAITLTPVYGGTSTTTVTALDNGNAINYSQLLAFNGFVNVDESSTNLTTILAQGDIGGNALTTTSQSYPLSAVGTSGVSGSALFQMRNNGNTLVSIVVSGTIADSTYPATINIGSIATVGGGPVEITLTGVNGTSGKGYCNITALDNGTPITYNGLQAYDGYLAIRQSASLTSSVISDGNIGTH